MQNDEVVKDIDIAIRLESASECSCDPEVGWFCERCFVISTLVKSRSLLTQRALDEAPRGCEHKNMLSSEPHGYLYCPDCGLRQ